jgi:hypothetical protein
MTMREWWNNCSIDADPEVKAISIEIHAFKQENIILLASYMFRMNGMPQVQGCAGAAMFRMNGSLFDILSTRHSYVLYIIYRGCRDTQERQPSLVP